MKNSPTFRLEDLFTSEDLVLICEAAVVLAGEGKVMTPEVCAQYYLKKEWPVSLTEVIDHYRDPKVRDNLVAGVVSMLDQGFAELREKQVREGVRSVAPERRMKIEQNLLALDENEAEIAILNAKENRSPREEGRLRGLRHQVIGQRASLLLPRRTICGCPGNTGHPFEVSRRMADLSHRTTEEARSQLPFLK